MATKNPFAKYALQTKKVKIEALDNAEIEIQEMTVAESTDFFKRVVSGYDEDGKAELNYNEIADIKIEKVAASMVSPKMTVDELKNLSQTASEAIDEIATAIDSFEVELKK